MNKKTLLLGLIATTGLTACSSTDTRATFERHRAGAEQGLQGAATPARFADTSPIKVRNGAFVGAKAIRNENGDPLPSRFQTEKGFTLVSPSGLGLREIAAEITKKTRIPVVVAQSVPPGTQPGATQSAPAAAPAAVPEIGTPLAGADFASVLASVNGGGALPAAGGAAGVISASTSSVSDQAIPLDYSGRLSGLLDVVGSHFNVAWRYEGGRIVLESVVTRSFDVAALAVLSNQSFRLSSTGESSGGEGGDTSGGQEATTSSTNDVYKEITAGLQSTIGGSGTFAVNAAAGVVTVTASPAAAARAGEYLKGINERLSRQVALSVKVYSVALRDNEQFDLNVAGIFSDGTSGVNLGGLAASGGVVPAVSGVGAGLGWALLDGDSRFSGSQAVANALAEKGQVSVVTTGSVTTLSGVPVPFQVGELRDYLAEVQREEDDEGNVTVSTTKATVNTGFNMQLTPRVDSNGDTLLQYGINITELTGANDGFDEVEIEGATIQQRRMTQRNFIQQARIPNRGTLVLAGFEQVRSENSRRGVGNANFPLLGGGRTSRSEREIIVIVITPTLLDMSARN